MEQIILEVMELQIYRAPLDSMAKLLPRDTGRIIHSLLQGMATGQRTDQGGECTSITDPLESHILH
jgi:hypothetical protein